MAARVRFPNLNLWLVTPKPSELCSIVTVFVVHHTCLEQILNVSQICENECKTKTTAGIEISSDVIGICWGE